MLASQQSTGHVAVTGAAGFIGRHVVAALRASGHRVVGIDRRAWTPIHGERAVIGDVLDPSTHRHLATAEAVVHLAGCPGVRDERPDAARWRWRDNVLSGDAVLRTVPGSTPLVVMSSSSVYGGAGDPADPRACHEDDPRRPRGGYARSKAVLEDLCQARRARGHAVAILRPFTVAGPGQRPDMALARWIEAVRSGAPVTVLGSLDRRRDITDVADVARAVLAALDHDLDGICNVGTGTTQRLADLLDAVVHAVGRPANLRVVPAADEEVAATRASTRRCRARLGFAPETDLAAVVTRQVAATQRLLAVG